jgi:hypothetical protein
MNRHEDMPADADVRETPPELFAELNARFDFTLDACATHANAKCHIHYTEQGLFRPYTGQMPSPDRFEFIGAGCGLTGAWEGERVWVNPPYSDIAPWILKAWESGAELVCMLVPATRTEQPWFQDLVEPYRDGKGTFEGSPMRLTTEFLRGRTHFLKNGKRIVCEKVGSKQFGKPSSAKFGCMLLVFQR